MLVTSSDEGAAAAPEPPSPPLVGIRLRASLLPKDDRSFADFMQEADLVPVVRHWQVPQHGDVCEIKANNQLWIAGVETHVTVSAATRAAMKKAEVWGKPMAIGRDGYVCLNGSEHQKLHCKLAASKKDDNFHDLLKVGWTGKKEDLVVLHLNDHVFDFNIENPRWHSQGTNMLCYSRSLRARRIIKSSAVPLPSTDTMNIRVLLPALPARSTLSTCLRSPKVAPYLTDLRIPIRP